jgi:hypothetical protein
MKENEERKGTEGGSIMKGNKNSTAVSFILCSFLNEVELDVFERMILRRENMDLGRVRVVNGAEYSRRSYIHFFNNLKLSDTKI